MTPVTRSRAEWELEGTMETVLSVLRDTGGVIEDYALMRARNYPDFWVKDAFGREYLAECKNLGAKKLDTPIRDGQLGKRYSGSRYWLHNLNWVKENILGKAWHEKSYFIRSFSGSHVHPLLTVNKPRPVLIVSHLNFTEDALEALFEFFGNDWIIVLGGQMGGTDYKPELVLCQSLNMLFGAKP